MNMVDYDTIAVIFNFLFDGWIIYLVVLLAMTGLLWLMFRFFPKVIDKNLIFWVLLMVVIVIIIIQFRIVGVKVPAEFDFNVY
jgi:hypothetical protein